MSVAGEMFEEGGRSAWLQSWTGSVIYGESWGGTDVVVVVFVKGRDG